MALSVVVNAHKDVIWNFIIPVEDFTFCLEVDQQ
jgi:hypothetical protein